MAKLLQVIATPNPEGISQSRRLGAAFTRAWLERHANGVVETLDLATEALPPLDAPMVAVLFGMTEGMPADLIEPRLEGLDRLTAQFLSADEYLLVSPMWNFGLPYSLKHYFDLVIRPGHTFGFGPTGPEGLLQGRRAAAVIARGLDYGPASPKSHLNHFEPHLRTLFGFMGITDFRTMALEGTQLPGGEDRMQEGLRAAARLGAA